MLLTSQATTVGLYLFLFLFRLVLVRETMRHDSSASRRKGRTPVRRPPMPTPGGSGATPSAPRQSGPPSEFGSCLAAVRVSTHDTNNYNSIKKILRTFNVNAKISGEKLLSLCQGPRHLPGREGSDPGPRPWWRSASSRRARISCSGRGPSLAWWVSSPETRPHSNLTTLWSLTLNVT